VIQSVKQHNYRSIKNTLNISSTRIGTRNTKFSWKTYGKMNVCQVSK